MALDTPIMPLTAAQIRQARVLLRWSSPRLSRAAKISFADALKAQDDETLSKLPFTDVWAIRASLEKAGVRFVVGGNGKPRAVLARNAR